MKLRIGTRGSKLALAQTGMVAAELRARGHETEIVVVRTAGDADQTSPFEQVGLAGVFVREIQAALLEHKVDLAVHSYKDLPSDVPAELAVAAVPAREDPRDRLVLARVDLDTHGPVPIRRGARVGTASARRAALLRDMRPDLVALHLRGNVTTRLGRLAAGDFDAILLAAAGLDRLRRSGGDADLEARLPDELVERELDPRAFVPAPSQGALALEVRAADEAARTAVSVLDDAAARRTVAVERALLARLEAGCQIAFGAWCEETEGELVLHAVFESDGSLRRTVVRGTEPPELVDAAHAALTAPYDARADARGGARGGARS